MTHYLQNNNNLRAQGHEQCVLNFKQFFVFAQICLNLCIRRAVPSKSITCGLGCCFFHLVSLLLQETQGSVVCVCVCVCVCVFLN